MIVVRDSTCRPAPGWTKVPHAEGFDPRCPDCRWYVPLSDPRHQKTVAEWVEARSR